jgi:hypothetical protein
MDSNKINISKIESFLYEKIDNVVSKNTFVGSKVPDKTAIPTDWNDIVLIDIPNGVRDFDAYGKGTVLVYMFARPQESGRKNVAVLSKMEARLNEVINTSSNDTYLLKRRLTFTGYDTNIDWHYNVIEITLTIL